MLWNDLIMNIGGSAKDLGKRKRRKGWHDKVKDYFEFKGVKYGIGTIVNVPFKLDTRWLPRDQLIRESQFVGQSMFVFTQTQGYITLYEHSGHLSGKYEQYIEIVQPVYYQEPEPPSKQNIFIRTKSGSWDAHNEVCVGLTWYIAIMVLAGFTNCTLSIWAIATIVYFSWKANK